MRGLRRRTFLRWLAASGPALWFARRSVGAVEPNDIITRAIPATGERLPVIGMGSWITFDVWGDPEEVATRVKVLQAFFDHGGALIDSSPMYDSSEKVIGYCLARIPNKQRLFAATKVWTFGRRFGIRQMERSEELWGLKRFDLIQIHNMLDWHTHLETLQAWKRDGQVRYIGMTTSHGRRHRRFAEAMADQPFDFVQFTYNIRDREAEQQLLPLAAERGMAVIINRPFRRGELFERTKGRPLPPWAAEFDCHNWAQFFLKFIVSHPAVTCAIPATSNPQHMVENMGAGYGRLPDPQTRQRMIRYFEGL